MRYVWTDAGFENVIVEDYHPGCPMTDKLYPPIHPGEMLQEDVLDGFGITQHKLAVSIGCPRGGSTRSSTASDGSRPILHCAWAATLRPQFWINLQARYDLEVEKDALGDSLDSIQPLRTA